MTVINSIADLRAIAQRRLPRALFDYIDRGSYDELTWARNRDDLRAITLRQRVMVDVSQPVAGDHRAWRALEHAAWRSRPPGSPDFSTATARSQAARAAQAAGVPFCLSTMSICSIEDVRAAVDGTFWFQLYLMRDRALQ